MNLETLIEEVQDLKRAKSLLKELFWAVGPYGSDSPPEELMIRLQNYFEFDDSE
jgi:hypothetical protein